VMNDGYLCRDGKEASLHTAQESTPEQVSLKGHLGPNVSKPCS
jgi:hypothetical protein